MNKTIPTSGFSHINKNYTSAGGSRPLPSAASLFAGGTLPGTIFILMDTGEAVFFTVYLSGGIVTPALYQLAGIGTGETFDVVMATGTNSIAHADTNITADSLVSYQQVGASPDATVARTSIEYTAGVGFTIHSNANATGNVTFRFQVEHY
jgi:hypothetical protein